MPKIAKVGFWLHSSGGSGLTLFQIAKVKTIYPADTDVFKTSSGRLKKVTTSCDQTRRRHNVWKKTSHLRRLEDV